MLQSPPGSFSPEILTFVMGQQCMMVILPQICSCVNILLQYVFSPPPQPLVVLFPTLSSAFPVRSGIAPA